MRKILINRDYGGFGLSKQALELYQKLSGAAKDVYAWEIPRDDPKLIEAVETIGLLASNTLSSDLKIVEIPEDVKWEIAEYDGLEWVAECRRTWG